MIRVSASLIWFAPLYMYMDACESPNARMELLISVENNFPYKISNAMIVSSYMLSRECCICIQHCTICKKTNQIMGNKSERM